MALADGDHARGSIGDPMIWAGLGLLASVVAALIYWQLVVAEGAYLGSRVVAWTYDRVARRYDTIKQFDPAEESWFLARPLLEGLQGVMEPLVLDVATGTGRLPQVLLHDQFDGRLLGLDLSQGMLRQARSKLNAYGDRVRLLWQDASRLPFGDEAFDAVACLESLEFLPRPRDALAEMVRVLVPGGVLMLSNRVGRDTWLLPRRAISRLQLGEVLAAHPVRDVVVCRWQVSYDLVVARKHGNQLAKGRGIAELESLLCCPVCREHLERVESGVVCPACARLYPVRDGIVWLESPVRYEPS